MQKRNKPIDSETLKKLEQEIYDNVMNYSNKNEVFLKLKELKNLSIHELRDVMPWKQIKKEITQRAQRPAKIPKKRIYE